MGPWINCVKNPAAESLFSAIQHICIDRPSRVAAYQWENLLKLYTFGRYAAPVQNFLAQILKSSHFRRCTGENWAKQMWMLWKRWKVMEYQQYPSYPAPYQPYSSPYPTYSSQPNHFNLKVGGFFQTPIGYPNNIPEFTVTEPCLCIYLCIWSDLADFCCIFVNLSWDGGFIGGCVVVNMEVYPFPGNPPLCSSFSPKWRWLWNDDQTSYKHHKQRRDHNQGCDHHEYDDVIIVEFFRSLSMSVSSYFNWGL